MPNPRRYKTKQEKKAANRAKSKRHYDKNREAILHARRQKSDDQTGPSINRPDEVHVHRSRLEKWVEHSNRVIQRIHRMTKDHEMQYLNDLRSKYATLGQDPLDNALQNLNKIHQSMERCSAGILQEDGAGINFDDVEIKLKKIRRLIKTVEAILCEVM